MSQHENRALLTSSSVEGRHSPPARAELAGQPHVLAASARTPVRQQGTQHFRKRREKSALILVSIVLIFLFCHTFRLTIQAYEVTHPSHSTAEHHDYCAKQER